MQNTLPCRTYAGTTKKRRLYSDFVEKAKGQALFHVACKLPEKAKTATKVAVSGVVRFVGVFFVQCNAFTLRLSLHQQQNYKQYKGGTDIFPFLPLYSIF